MKYLLLLTIAYSVSAQEVTLSLPDYLELRQEAGMVETQPIPAPIPAAIESVVAHLEIDPQRARVTQVLTIHLLDNEWHQLPLPGNGAFIEADFGSAEGRLAGKQDWLLHVRGKGRHTLRVVSVLGVERDEKAARPTW